MQNSRGAEDVEKVIEERTSDTKRSILGETLMRYWVVGAESYYRIKYWLHLTVDNEEKLNVIVE
jgi:hypothetical protein